MSFKISILGSGNVATHLSKEFYKNNIFIEEIYSRNLDNAKKLALEINANYTNSLENLKEVDLYIICIPDDSINEISNKIPYSNKLVIHTSGSINIDNINSKNNQGVFYPLQTFSKNKETDFSKIPICIESKNTENKNLLIELAKKISPKVYLISSEQREILHISAVFVNNFVNHLYSIGENICNENKIPFDILKPLIEETAFKINKNSPKEIQTGPAKRNDLKVIEEHLNFLQNKNYKEIYNLITKSIINENSNS